MFGRFKVAHLIGTTRNNEEQFREIETELTKLGYICFAPVIYVFDEYMENKDLIDSMCEEKLKVADICVLVTEHIGESTMNRIMQARELGKPIYNMIDGKLYKLE